MRIFISWSGDMSRELGEAFRDWLPSVIQMVKPYFTPSDIEKGARWSNHIANELQGSRIGIFCMTRGNLNSPWIMFEAGAISKVVSDAYVCPILFGLDDTDITGPLVQFQLTKFNKAEIKRLITLINQELGDNKLSDKTRDSVFEVWWPRLEEKVTPILEKYSGNALQEIRTDKDILKEILNTVRLLSREKVWEEVRTAVSLTDEANWLTNAVAALRPEASTIERRKAIQELTPAFLEKPRNRKFAIFLGRLFKANHEYSEAIEYLTKFLTAKEEARELDIDYGDVLYNRACYKTLLWATAKDELYREQAYVDLEKSIMYHGLCREQEKVDDDFKFIWEEDRFKKLTAPLSTDKH